MRTQVRSVEELLYLRQEVRRDYRVGKEMNRLRSLTKDQTLL